MSTSYREEAELRMATDRLDDVIDRMNRHATLRKWRFWHGSSSDMDPGAALQADTSGWAEVTTPVHWSTASGDTWLRVRIAYPESVEGISTRRSTLQLLCTLLVNSKVFVDGRLAAGHDWWLDARVSPISLADEYAPGQPIEVACHVPQGDGLGSFDGADVRCGTVSEVVDRLELLRAQLTFSCFLASRDSDGDRLDRWRDLVGALPWDALQARDWEAWRSGTATVVSALAALAPEAKDYQVHAAAHAHIDMNWLWPWEDTVDVIQRDFSTMDQLMERYPDFSFSQSQASTYWAMEAHRPDILRRVKERVGEGRWEVTANTWVENDLNMSSGEAIAHHLLYTRRYMRELFGAAPRLLWEPDTFGHPATMPQIARKSGVEYYYFCRGGKRYPLFWWEANDGSRVLGFQDLHWYLGSPSPRVVSDSAIELGEQYGLRDSLVVYGAGDHGGGATARDIEMAKRINDSPCLPAVKLDAVAHFFDKVKAANPDLPVVIGEMNPVFAGCYTSHADVKLLNRRGETALLDAEAAAAVAAIVGGMPYPRAKLQEAWRTVLFQQFHDILCGCGIGITSKTAHEWSEPAIVAARQVTRNALTALCQDLDVGDGPAISVFNQLPWERTAEMRVSPGSQCASLTDDRGRSIPVQPVGRELVFVAEDVPALGFRVYHPSDASAPSGAADVRAVGELGLENAHLRFEVDGRSGAITRLFDKEGGRDLTWHSHGDPGAELETTGVLNRMQILWEQPHGMSAWKLGNISRVDHLVSGAYVRMVEAGPVRGIIEVRRAFLNSSLVQRIVLHRGSRRIDFETEIDWHERGSDSTDAPMLRVVFEPFLGETEATYQIPFGTIVRPADGQEVVGQMWMDISEAGEGRAYGVALLNDCKYGHQAHGNSLGLTLVRASYEPDQNPDEGLHRFTYSLYPHLDSWREAEVDRRARELNHPMPARELDGVHRGEGSSALRPGDSFLTCRGEGVSVTAFKLAESGNGAIVRLVEIHGNETVAELQLAVPVLAAEEKTLAEESMPGGTQGLAVANGLVRIALHPYEIRTVGLSL